MMADEVGRPDAYRDVAAAIRASDGELAERAARNLLEPATTALLAALDALEDQR
jgi:DNA-binding FadR family transcriptional regulator